ncbi:glycosyltransferase [bacterium]|nr:glycosyltransferase [bacterium]MBU1753148.1 glycosyltransferase [bacterium]
MRHLLLISYDFPQQISESEYRAAGWVKHLPSFGWDVTVLTVETNRGEADLAPMNNEEEQYPTVCEVKSDRFSEKTGIIKNLVSTYLIPDEKILWTPNVLRKVKELTGKQGFDLIYTIAPPYSISLIGYQVHCQTGIPWIADIRENWVGTKKQGIFSNFYKNIEKKMEETIIKNARRVISPSEEWCQFFYEKYPFWGRDRFVCIPDGYDTEEMEIVDTSNRVDDKLRLVCPGVIDKNTTHQYLLRAIKEMIKKDAYLGDLLRVEFIGDMDEEQQRLMDEFPLKNVCSYIEDTSGKEGMRRLITADAGIIIADKERNIPQAIYKCLVAMKPILGLSNKGAVENLIRKENLGWVVPFSSIPGIKSALQVMIDCYKRGVLKPNYSLELSIKYEKKATTQRLTELFDKVVNEKQEDNQLTIQKFGYRGNL